MSDVTLFTELQRAMCMKNAALFADWLDRIFLRFPITARTKLLIVADMPVDHLPESYSGSISEKIAMHPEYAFPFAAIGYSESLDTLVLREFKREVSERSSGGEAPQS